MSHDIQSRKSWSITYRDGKAGLLRFPFARPDSEGFADSLARQLYEPSYPDYNPLKQNQRFTFDPKWDSLTAIDMFLKDGWDYGEITFEGSSDPDVQDAAYMLKLIAGGVDGERGGFTPKVFDPQTGAVLWQGEEYSVLYGDWIAEERYGKAIMVPTRLLFPDGRNRLTMQEALRVKLNIREGSEDRLKIRKYFKRWKAPHIWAVKGTFGKQEQVVVRSPAKLLGGDVVKDKPLIMGTAIDVQFGSVTGKFLYVDLDQYGEEPEASAGDGRSNISVKFLKMLGEDQDDDELRRMRVGDGFKLTHSASSFFCKGLAYAMDFGDSPYAGIFYGPKPQMEFQHAYLASMGDIGDVDDSVAYTEVQSMICFMTESNYKLWIDLNTRFLQLMENGLYDEEMLRFLLLTHMDALSNEEHPDAEIWSLLEAVRNGIPLRMHPALMERVKNYLLTTVLVGKRGRIPYGDKAHLAFFQADDAMFDLHTGNIDVDQSSILESQVACPDAPGGQTLVVHRRPIGNNKEAIFAVNLGNDELRRFKKYRGRGRCILGRGIAQQYKQAQGADGDDQVVVITDPEWVQAWMSVPKYPDAEMPKEDLDALEMDNEDVNGLLDYQSFDEESPYLGDIGQDTSKLTEWQLEHCWEACDNALALAITIGMVSNVNTLDQQLSGPHKEHMLIKLADRIKKSKTKAEFDFGVECFTWLQNRSDYECRVIANHLEAFIDNIKMGKGNAMVLRKLWFEATKVSGKSLVYPWCWTWMGRSVSKGGRGTRIPAKRQEARDYAVGVSLLDEVLWKVMRDIGKVETRFKDQKWVHAVDVPARLKKVFPRNAVTVQLAEELLQTWKGAWTMYLNGKIDKARTEVEHDMRWIIIHGGMIYFTNGTTYEHLGVRTMFRRMTVDETGHYDEVKQCSIAVEIARLSYETLYRNDNFLWTDFMAQAYVRAWKLAGLAGQYVPVKLDRHHGDLRSTNKDSLLRESMERTRMRKEGKVPPPYAGDRIQVRVERATLNGELVVNAVFRKSDGSFLGEALGEIPDGEYLMIDTLIEVKPAHPEVTRKRL